MEKPATPVHARSITVTTSMTGEDTIVVEGRLKDERLVDTYSLAKGAKMDPGTVHDFTVRLFISGAGLSITDVEVDMDHAPREDCLETRESLRPLIGKAIAPGFTGWVKKTLGGPHGCMHLNSLVIAMASAAVQGFWSARTSRRMDVKQATEGLAPEFLIDTCRVWRSDGPLVSELSSLMGGREPGK